MSEASDAADDLEQLADAAGKAEDALKKAEKAAGLTGQKLGKLKELAVGAVGGEETVEKWKKGTEALSLMGDKSATTGQKVVAGASALKYMGAAALSLGSSALGAAQAVVQFIADVEKATATVEAHDQRLHALRGSMDAMRAATAGAVDTQAAFNLQFALAERGIATSAENMATLTRVTREHAQSRQISQEQASAVVQRALDGDAQAATQLGIRIGQTTTTSERHASVLRQLEERYRGVSAGSQTAAERAVLYDQAQQQVNARMTKAAGEFLRYTTAIGQIHTLLVRRAQQTSEAQQQASESQQRADRELLNLAQRRKQAADQQAQLDAQHAAAALAAAQTDLRMLGEHVEALGPTITAQEEYNRALTEANNIAKRSDESQPAFDQRRLDATNRLTAAIRRKQEELARKDGELQAQRELGLLAHTIRAHGGVVDARIRSLGPAQLYRDLQAEIAGFAQRENENTTQATQRLAGLIQRSDQARQQANQEARQAQETRAARREERDLLTEAENLHAKRAVVERMAGETTLDLLRRRNEAQREFNQLAQQGAEEARTAFNEFAQRTREQLALERQKEEEVRAAEVERTTRRNAERAEKEREAATLRADANEARFAAERADALDQRVRESFNLAQEQATTATQAMAAGAKTAYDAFGELASGIAGAVKAAAEKGEDAGAAVAKYVDDWAGAKALQWGLQAAEAIAGAGVAYFIRPDAVPGLLASAAQYAGLAAVAGITTAAIPNAPASSTGAAGGDRLAASSRNESSANAKGPSYVINVSGFVTREDVEDGLVRAMRSAQSRHGDFLRQ